MQSARGRPARFAQCAFDWSVTRKNVGKFWQWGGSDYLCQFVAAELEQEYRDNGKREDIANGFPFGKAPSGCRCLAKRSPLKMEMRG